jgi:predicted enzyme related to lactoylglutathione lyase
MTNVTTPPVGTIVWMDLTVPDAEALRDFYAQVVGWDVAPVQMGGYSDFTMMPPSVQDPVAGVCHARGENIDLPAQWLMYVVVEDVERSAAECTRLGGQIVAGPRPLMGGLFCVMRDPAGAVCALFEPPRVA